MRALQIIICLALLAGLVWLNRTSISGDAALFGGLSLLGWASIALTAFFIAFIAFFGDLARAVGLVGSRRVKFAAPKPVRVLTEPELRELGLEKYRGPAYPHPVIFPERCIGCQACVDACPHDVLAIVNGTAAAVAPDLCMEDTACQAECPVNPKACIVINTAKEVRSLPTPDRNGATYETNVAGCYIIGDVSGVPLIKNAVKEGAEVIEQISGAIRASSPEPRAEYDVVIVGMGPGGASAAAAAQRQGLKYVALEQEELLSTIKQYPKGKYVFFKPDVKDWSGGIGVAGLGLTKAKYAADDATGDRALLGPVLENVSRDMRDACSRLRQGLLGKMPASVASHVADALDAKINKEFLHRIAALLKDAGASQIESAYGALFLPQRDALIEKFSSEIFDQLTTKIPGDQRETILDVWAAELTDAGVRINENESCKSVRRAEDGDYFVVQTERGSEKEVQRYTARKVVLAIGLRGAPNKLRLPNEDLTVTMNGRTEKKVLYSLSNPMDFRGKRIVIVGGGNVAVEAAVDLVAIREGSSISPRDPSDMNHVTLLVRTFLAPTVKFGNKYQLYNCAENGLIDLKFGVGIKELREFEVVLENVRSKEVVATLPNDYVFALIGGERPNAFLESIGIKIR